MEKSLSKCDCRNETANVANGKNKRQNFSLPKVGKTRSISNFNSSLGVKNHVAASSSSRRAPRLQDGKYEGEAEGINRMRIIIFYQGLHLFINRPEKDDIFKKQHLELNYNETATYI